MTTLPRPRSQPPSASSPPFGKSALDRSVATLLLLLTGLWLAVIALAVWLTDDGPLLVRETRVGRYGRSFSLLRFRTTPWGRTTGFGQVLERYHLDHLPQLINVVRGDMSLVGPRARPVAHARAFLHPDVRPGLICPWDPRTPPRSDAEETRALQAYLQEWSPRRDLVLAWRALRGTAR